MSLQEAAAKPTCITDVAGYDLGLSHYLIGNDGSKVANPRHLVNAYRRLRRDSTALSSNTLDQWFTSSKTCHCCGYRMPEIPLKVREWTCPGCNGSHDRDIYAALNIQHKGITELMAAGSSHKNQLLFPLSSE